MDGNCAKLRSIVSQRKHIKTENEMKKLITFVGLIVAISVVAQDKQAKKFAKTITVADLTERLTVLSSDEYEGRETGKKGQKMAARYIAGKFKEFGLEAPVNGSYFQKFDLTESTIGALYFRKGDDKKMGFDDFVYFSRSETSGEEYIKVMMAGDDDMNKDSYEGMYLAYVTEKMGGLEDRVNVAKEAGALGFLIVITNEDEFGSLLDRYGSYMKRASLGLEGRDNESDKMILTNKKLLVWMFGKEFDQIENSESVTVILNADYLDKPVGTENVLGYLKGSEKPDELIVVTSHYDHVGIIDGKIYNGADDDGSGTTTVLEIAQAFTTAAAKGKGPKRSMLFMTVTGEEKGLLGSEYYTDNPVFPLENTITNLNIDMVGRVDDAHAENPNYVYLIGADKLSQELHDLSEKVNKTYANLDLDYTYNDENDPNRFYYRSDHYNFAKHNIPIIFYFNGTHADYHQHTDTIEKINFEVMQSRARLVFHTAWEVANRDKRITADKLEGAVEKSE